MPEDENEKETDTEKNDLSPSETARKLFDGEVDISDTEKGTAKEKRIADESNSISDESSTSDSKPETESEVKNEGKKTTGVTENSAEGVENPDQQEATDIAETIDSEKDANKVEKENKQDKESEEPTPSEAAVAASEAATATASSEEVQATAEASAESTIKKNSENKNKQKTQPKHKGTPWIKIIAVIAIIAILGFAFKDKLLRQNPSGSPDLTPVAIVNGEEITQSDLDKAYLQLNPLVQMQINKLDFLNNTMITERVLYQEAQALGYTVSRSEIDAAIENIIADSPYDRSMIDEQLKSQNLTWDDLKKAISIQLSIQNMLNDTLKPVPPTIEKMQEFYDNNQNQFISPAKVHAKHILICFNSSLGCTSNISKSEAFAKARKIKDLAKNTNFSDLAMNYSDDPSALSNGGDLGFFERGQMVPEFETASFNAPENTLIGPVETQYGFHVIWVVEKVEDRLIPFAEARQEIEDAMIFESQQNQLIEFIEGLRNKADIKILLESETKQDPLMLDEPPRIISSGNDTQIESQDNLSDFSDSDDNYMETDSQTQMLDNVTSTQDATNISNQGQDNESTESNNTSPQSTTGSVMIEGIDSTDSSNESTDSQQTGSSASLDLSSTAACANKYNLTQNTIIFYYAESCPPCKNMMQDIRKLEQEGTPLYYADYFDNTSDLVDECYSHATNQGLPVLICAGTGTKKVGYAEFRDINSFATTCK